MSEPFTAEIRIFGFDYAPRDWARCDGQLMKVQDNTALFSLIGCTFGGDCRTTFGLPNLQGRSSLHQGRGPGLSSYQYGWSGGYATVPLTQDNLPSHNHALAAKDVVGDQVTPSPTEALAHPNPKKIKGIGTMRIYAPADSGGVPMDSNTLATSGKTNHPHENRQPFLVSNFCICLNGIYPPRS